MSAQTDFYQTLDRAAGLTLDAASAARTAGYGRLPRHLRRGLTRATRQLERAQDELFILARQPWDTPPPPRQLSLEVLA